MTAYIDYQTQVLLKQILLNAKITTILLPFSLSSSDSCVLPYYPSYSVIIHSLAIHYPSYMFPEEMMVSNLVRSNGGPSSSTGHA